ncbi:regulator of nonsense transcripts 3A isoform X3 [Nelusetta ayraudi]|uniref:regulator of nonsense transcripts 3A isoform X3 n=1 Tax=Nelusetta ayraudi TaxID=303726 RepID=UPI003F727722
MRSEKEQMTAGKEKNVVELQFRDIPGEQEHTPGSAKQKDEKKEVFSKVVLRRLPPSLSKDQLEEQLSPLPSFDYFEFFPADQSLYPHLFSRAYINFKNPDDILLFRDRFDGYVFIDNKAKRTTPLLEYIKNKKIEKQRIREEKREERRRRELEKKRQREEEKRKRREEERRKRKEAEKQKKLSDKDIKIKLLKKSDRDDDVDSDRIKDKSDNGETERGKWEKAGGQMKPKDAKEKGQPESDKEQREQHGRRQRDKDHRGKDEERKRQRHHYEFDKFMRRKDETKWGKGYCQDRAKKEGHHHGYSYCSDGGDKLGKEDRDELSNRKERLRNKVSEKDRPAMQLYQPGARNRKRMSSAGKGYDCIPLGHSPEPASDHCFEVVTLAAGLEKVFEKSKEVQ